MYSFTQLTENLLFDIDQKSISTSRIFQTGFSRFDNQTGGISAGDLMLISSPQIVLSRSMMLSIISNNRKTENLDIIYFSTLLSSSQITKMLICNQLNIEFLQLQRRDLTEKQLDEIDIFSKDMYVYFNDSMDLTVDLICLQLDKMLSENRQIVILDYLNCFEKNDENISDKLFNLKQIARKYDLPVIVLYENKMDFGEKENPRIESELNSIGFDVNSVDILCNLYRPEYYGILEDDKEKSTVGLTKLDTHYQRQLLDQIDLVYRREFYQIQSINEF